MGSATRLSLIFEAKALPKQAHGAIKQGQRILCSLLHVVVNIGVLVVCRNRLPLTTREPVKLLLMLSLQLMQRTMTQQRAQPHRVLKLTESEPTAVAVRIGRQPDFVHRACLQR